MSKPLIQGGQGRSDVTEDQVRGFSIRSAVETIIDLEGVDIFYFVSILIMLLLAFGFF